MISFTIHKFFYSDTEAIDPPIFPLFIIAILSEDKCLLPVVLKLIENLLKVLVFPAFIEFFLFEFYLLDQDTVGETKILYYFTPFFDLRDACRVERFKVIWDESFFF